jgi:hypothetical protein
MHELPSLEAMDLLEGERTMRLSLRLNLGAVVRLLS